MATLLPCAGIRPRVHSSVWIARTATLNGNVEIEAEASIWFGALLRSDYPEREIRILSA